MVDVKATASKAVVVLLTSIYCCGCASTEELFPEYDESFCVSPELSDTKQPKLKSKSEQKQPS